MPKDYEYVKDENGELIYIRAVSEKAIRISMNEEEKLNALSASFEKLSTLRACLESLQKRKKGVK